MITDIVFDLGGVLVDWNPVYFYNKVFDTRDKVDYFLNHICTFEWNAAQDGGRTIREANDFLIGKHPEHAKEITMYYQHWEEMFSGEITGTVNILKNLLAQNNHGVYALTNWSAETFPRARKLFPFFNDFHGIVVSGEEKLMKPDRKIYEVLISRFDLVPEKTVYIDDSLPNVKAAEEIGFKAFHFKGPGELKTFLDEVL